MSTAISAKMTKLIYFFWNLFAAKTDVEEGNTDFIKKEEIIIQYTKKKFEKTNREYFTFYVYVLNVSIIHKMFIIALLCIN